MFNEIYLELLMWTLYDYWKIFKIDHGPSMLSEIYQELVSGSFMIN